MGQRTLNLDIYPAVLHACYSPQQWLRIRDELGWADWLDDQPNAQGRTSSAVFEPDDGSPSAVHVVVYITVDDDAANTITHETIHAVTQIYDHIGQKMRGDEVTAYLAGHIAGWLHSNLPKPKGKAKAKGEGKGKA